METHGDAGGVNVALDELGFPRGLRRLHPETLKERRVHRTGDHGDEAPEADGRDGQGPTSLAGVHQKQGGGE